MVSWSFRTYIVMDVTEVEVETENAIGDMCAQCLGMNSSHLKLPLINWWWNWNWNFRISWTKGGYEFKPYEQDFFISQLRIEILLMVKSHIECVMLKIHLDMYLKYAHIHMNYVTDIMNIINWKLGLWCFS